MQDVACAWLLRIIFSVVFICTVPVATTLGSIYDFDVSESIVALGDFISGGPEKDDIPALTRPIFISEPHFFLYDDDLVIGFAHGREAKAYPLKILNWHEIVNDTVSKMPVAVTWCPLTKSAIVFARTVKDETVEFGVSGLLYNSNLVMYDKGSNGLWPQLSLGAVTGKNAMQPLRILPSVVTTWKEWSKKYPRSLILSKNTGFVRSYDSDPYQSYHRNRKTVAPLKHRDKRLSAKSTVIGITMNGITKAYPIKVLKHREGPVEDTIGGVNIRVHAGPKNTAYITDERGELLPGVVMYWFAWSAFNKDTLLYSKQDPSPPAYGGAGRPSPLKGRGRTEKAQGSKN